MNEYFVKLAALREYEVALRIRKSEEEILEAFQGLFREFMDYCEKNGMDIPDRQRYLRILGRSIDLLEARASPESKHRDDHEDDPRGVPSSE
jgi:phosphate uptake regulator